MARSFLMLALLCLLALAGVGQARHEFNREIVQAAEDDDLAKVKELVAQGAGVDEQSKGIVPLHLAIKNRNLEMVRYLLDQKADPNVPNPTGESPAQIATIAGTPEILEAVLTHPDVDINYKTPFGYSLLHVAAQTGKLRAVQILRERGYANWNHQNDYKDTALNLALKFHFREVAWDLVKSEEVEVELPNDQNWTAFLLAVVDGDRKIVQYLREVRKADDKVRNSSGEVALHRAIQHSNNDVADYLVNVCGHEVEPLDLNGWTPLHYAVLLGNPDGFDFLVGKGADPLKATGEGYTLQVINNRSKHTSSEMKEVFRQKLAAYFPEEPQASPSAETASTPAPAPTPAAGERSEL